MSAGEDPRGHEHVGDEYVTYNICKEGQPRFDFPPFPPSLEEEEETQRKVDARVEREVECEAERML
jgi:hypothetical protein